MLLLFFAVTQYFHYWVGTESCEGKYLLLREAIFKENYVRFLKQLSGSAENAVFYYYLGACIVFLLW